MTICRNPVVGAPIIGATKKSHIDEAIHALSIELTDEEAARLEASYTPRVDVNVKNSGSEVDCEDGSNGGHPYRAL